MKTQMLLNSVFVLPLFFLFVNCSPGKDLYMANNCFLVATKHEAIRPEIDDTMMQYYLRRFYDGEIYVPRLSNEVLAKRAVLPYSGGFYGKRAALPFSGGIYGKRSSDSIVGDLLDDHVAIETRAMPMNGGFFGR